MMDRARIRIIAQQALDALNAFEAIPERNEKGQGINHAAFMAHELVKVHSEIIDSDTKANRWLGYLQCMLVYEGISDLQAEKLKNKSSSVRMGEHHG